MFGQTMKISEKFFNSFAINKAFSESTRSRNVMNLTHLNVQRGLADQKCVVFSVLPFKTSLLNERKVQCFWVITLAMISYFGWPTMSNN